MLGEKAGADIVCLAGEKRVNTRLLLHPRSRLASMWNKQLAYFALLIKYEHQSNHHLLTLFIFICLSIFVYRFSPKITCLHIRSYILIVPVCNNYLFGDLFTHWILSSFSSTGFQITKHVCFAFSLLLQEALLLRIEPLVYVCTQRINKWKEKLRVWERAKSEGRGGLFLCLRPNCGKTT